VISVNATVAALKAGSIGGRMESFGNQAAARIETIPLAPAMSIGTDAIKLYAQALANRYRSETLLLHVIDLGSACGLQDAEVPVNTYRVFEENCLEDVICDGKGRLPGTDHPEIKTDPDLMVIGTRGPADLSRMVLGATAQEFHRRAGIPVLSVGPGVPFPQRPIHFETIVYLTDYSPEAAKACVPSISFAQEVGAQVYVCHVRPDSEQGSRLDEDDLNDRFMGALQAEISQVPPEWADPDCIFDHQFAADGILLVAQQVRASLIVIGMRGARFGAADPTGPLAFQVISGSSCPVLSFLG
jgi:nucleotide-binding universal stress UspA family protein